MEDKMIRMIRAVSESLIVILLFIGCQSNNSNPPPSSAITPGECEIALVKLFDVSGSMGFDIGTGQSLLDILKPVAVSVVQVVPADQWNMGLATFPSTGGPTWGMEVLTELNRQELIDAINDLSAGGSSPMDAGLTLAGLMLSTDQVRPRFLVVFSDGDVCSECSTILNTASYLKTELGIFIITVGYHLESDDYDTMRDLASLQPDGTPAFFNSGSADELVDFLTYALGSLCDRLEVAIETEPAYLIGDGGSETGGYNVKYIQGESRTVRIVPQGTLINGGGSVEFSSPTGTLSDTSPSFGGKLEVRSATGMSGEYDLTLRVVPDGGDVTLATRTIQITVVPVDLSISFDGNVVFNPATSKIEGRVRIDINTAREVELNVNYKVTTPGSPFEASGFTYPVPPSPTVPAGASSIPIQFSIDRVDAAAGLYDVHVTVILKGLGVQKSVIANDVSVP